MNPCKTVYGTKNAITGNEAVKRKQRAKSKEQDQEGRAELITLFTRACACEQSRLPRVKQGIVGWVWASCIGKSVAG